MQRHAKMQIYNFTLHTQFNRIAIAIAMAPASQHAAPAKPASKKGAQTSLKRFFKPASKLGRACKKPETRGRKAIAADATDDFPPSNAAAAEPPPAKSKATRTNWSKGENYAKLKAAVEEWNSKTGRAAPRLFLVAAGIYEPNPRSPSLDEFSKIVGIPKGTLAPYVTTLGKRRVIGAQVGKKTLLPKDDSRVLVDTMRRYDRGNDGLSRAQILDVLQELSPSLTRDQACSSLRTVRRNNSAPADGSDDDDGGDDDNDDEWGGYDCARAPRARASYIVYKKTENLEGKLPKVERKYIFCAFKIPCFLIRPVS